MQGSGSRCDQRWRGATAGSDRKWRGAIAGGGDRSQALLDGTGLGTVSRIGIVAPWQDPGQRHYKAMTDSARLCQIGVLVTPARGGVIAGGSGPGQD